MAEIAVPISMGSPEFVTREVGGLRVTHAHFPPGALLEPHVHDRPTLAVMLSGGFELAFTSPVIRRNQLACVPGTIFTEPAEEKHANRIAQSGATVVVVQPDPERDDLLRPCRAVLEGIHFFRSGRISLAARGLVREIHSPDEVSTISIEALALEILVVATRIGSVGRWEAGSPLWLARAEEYVHEYFHRPIRIADVAEAAAVHPAHLAATFRSAYRMPLGTYVRRLRVEWAADQLARTEQPIASVAIQAGFADQAHLTRVFKRYTGWTPARYRKARRRRRANVASSSQTS